MDMSAHYKTSDGKVVELKQQSQLNLWYMNIIELIIPDGCKWVRVDMKSITELNKVDYLNLYI